MMAQIALDIIEYYIEECVQVSFELIIAHRKVK